VKATLVKFTIVSALMLTVMNISCPVYAGQGIWTSNGPEGGEVDALLASPFNQGEFYAIGGTSIFKSTDGGQSWFAANAGVNRQVLGIVHSQTADNRLMAMGVRRVYFTNDGGVIWQDRTPAIPLPANIRYTDLQASPTQPGVYYLIRTDSVILRTADSGLNWTELPAIPQSPGFSIQAFVADPATTDRLLVSTRESSSSASLWVADVSASSPSAVWSEVPCPSGCPWETFFLRDIQFDSAGRAWSVGIPTGVFRSEDAGLNWTSVDSTVSGIRLAINPQDPAEVYVVGGQGIQYTKDDGANWTSIIEGLIGNELLQPATAGFVTFDPFDPSLQLVGSFPNGIYRRISPVSSDIFAQSNQGFEAQSIRAIATAAGGRVHAALSDIELPAFASFRSEDRGNSWTQANNGLDAYSFRALVVDPNNTDVVYGGGIFSGGTDAQGVFIPGNGGLYKSTDAGVNWSTIDTGIPLQPSGFAIYRTVRDIEVDRFSADSSGDSQVLYAGAEGRLANDGMGTIVKQAARIYKSTDAGANWFASDNGLGGGELDANGIASFVSVVQLVQDTTDTTGNTLYASTFINFRSSTAPLTLENGVFKTVDGGANWFNAANGLPRINNDPTASTLNVLSLAFDPTDPSGQTLYASVNDLVTLVFGSVYKTVDGGLNWTFSGSGLEERDVRDIVVDPDSGDVYAAIADPFGNGDGGVFVSSDDGASWSSISTGFPTTAVPLKLALDTSDSNIVIHAGTNKSVQTFEVVPDGDTDGASNTTEGDAPNGGDGNADGVPDQTQSDVASPTVNSNSRGAANYITASLNGIDGNCQVLQDSFGLDLLDNLPAEPTYEPPLNGLHLRIPDCEQAEVTLIYHGADFSDPSYVLRGYGLAFPDQDRAIWHELPATLNGQEWTVTLTDGAPGDATPDDGIIVFQGAAKRLVEAFFSDSMEAE